MNIAELDFRVGLIVNTPGEVEVITSILGVSPSRVFHSENRNIWTLSRRHGDQVDLDNCIQEYFMHISDYEEKIRKVKQYGTCVFRISVVSCLGQFGFSLSESDLQLLTKLDIPVEVTVFSFGLCVDDSEEEE